MVLVGIMLALRRRQWPSITSALGQCIMLVGVSGAGILNIISVMKQSKNTVQSPDAVSMTGQRRRLWVTLKQNRLNATCLRKVYNRPGD